VLCVPAAPPQEASDQPGPGMTCFRSWGPCQTPRARSALCCQPHFLLLRFPTTFWHDRTSLCWRFLKDSRSGRSRRKNNPPLPLTFSPLSHANCANGDM